jgi:hypothetical protein
MPSQEYGNFNLRARVRTAVEENNIVHCDFNEDGQINREDVITLLTYLRDNPGDLKADFNADGYANVLDAIAMLLAQHYGTCL